MKPVSEFSAHAYTTTGGNRGTRYKSTCKLCTRITRSKRRVANRDVIILKERKHRRDNRASILVRERRYKEANLDRVRHAKKVCQQRRWARSNVSAAENRYIVNTILSLSRFGDKYLDAYSGHLIDAPTIDHIEPLCRGGLHHVDNLCVTSKTNNSSKGTNSVLIYLLERLPSPSL